LTGDQSVADLQVVEINLGARTRYILTQHTSLTGKQRRLFQIRGSAGSEDIVVYFIKDTVPRMAGYAIFPDDKPGAIVTYYSGQDSFVMAHEIGHVLGLEDIEDDSDPSSIMYVNATPTSPLNLNEDERKTVCRSNMVHPV
jgi:hypothetical protein